MLIPWEKYYYSKYDYEFVYVGEYLKWEPNEILEKNVFYFLTDRGMSMASIGYDDLRRPRKTKFFHTVDEVLKYMDEHPYHYQADEIIRRHCEELIKISPLVKTEFFWLNGTQYEYMGYDEYNELSKTKPKKTLPKRTFKVIFNEEKGKTTLLIGEAPYDDESEVFIAKLNREAGRPFNHKLGFTIAFLKYIIQEEQPESLQYYDYDEYMEFMDFITKGDFDRQLDIIGTDILRYLDTELHFSKRQIAKFCETTFDKPLIIKIPYAEYVFEFEFRGETKK